ncbi:putative aerolysin, Agglutinin domain, aerolysin-like toxin, beta complex domain-containing protein [Rosa chinensis]|uniref:Putative aerolysin, Agglutinin domain, aerolysin-like toxin, beta complex domain-containing protein n=1 Tax=Rosa chinensis TaxID=74649 RepID=A0A2P6S3D0_ROSCH|nr:putative aerolysin, Agglutinin domain, aerolysin-like toxin, beta complex domain-containing protein [Rosa chinensis]
MSFLLPPTIALKSSHLNAYVNYIDDSAASATYGFLQVNGGNVFSPLAKFEVVTANTGTGLVHIRCSHNKKFVRWRTQHQGYLSPEADEPEEDQSIWSCTLFQPQVAEDGDPKKVLLFHVGSKQYARAINEGGVTYMRTDVIWNNQSTFYITDLESLVILPKHVAFKANNDRYLQHADSNQLRFMSTDKGIPESWFEVDTDGDGRARIKVFNSLSNNHLRFGGASFGNAIFADGNSNGFPAPTLFLPVKVDSSTVALKCLGNNRFCTRHTGSIQDGLSANETSTSISNSARFRLEELVLSRRIYNTNFDLANAIIYGETPITMATANASNNSSVDNTVEFKFAYTESKSSTWSSSHSWMVGVSVTVSLNIPFGLGGVETTYYGEYNGSYEWGETITTENTLETTYTATVPANTSISVSLMSTKGYCDVPYSYYQRDVLYNGETVVYKKDDGLYTGINSYNFHYVVTTLRQPESRADLSTREQKLPDPSVDPSKQEIVPMPVPSASTTRVQNVTSTTTPDQELSKLGLEDAVARSAMKP